MTCPSFVRDTWPEYKETDKILRWRYVKERGQVTLQFLITFKNQPIDESAWVDFEDIHADDRRDFLEDLKKYEPSKDPSSDKSVSDRTYTHWRRSLEGELSPRGG